MRGRGERAQRQTTHRAVEVLELRHGAAARAVAARLGEGLDLDEVVAARRHAAVPALPVEREAHAVPVHARALEEGAHRALHAHRSQAELPADLRVLIPSSHHYCLLFLLVVLLMVLLAAGSDAVLQ